MMPGSGLKSFEMVEKEANLVDPFFDSEEDEVPVDMEMVFEAMKHVPLPDLDYPEHEDPISVDASFAEPFSGTTILARSNAFVLQSALKRKNGSADTGHPQKKGEVPGNSSKRFKVEKQRNDLRSRLPPKQAAKVESVDGGVAAVAAKVAAEVAPNVVTGGVVAESGPRPDFSLWTVEDDLLLKNAMEVGASMEALAKGAMRFSRRFSVKELRERWRALLYDPEISAQAALRMATVEYGNDSSKPKGLTGQNSALELARKRRASSVRTLYYKKIRSEAAQDTDRNNTCCDVESTPSGAPQPINGLHSANSPESVIKTLLEALPIESENAGLVPPENATTVESEEQAFSQMFSLLASGGVQAVLWDIQAGSVTDVPELETGFGVMDLQQANNFAPTGELMQLEVPEQVSRLKMEVNENCAQSRSTFEMSVEVKGISTRTGDCTPMESSVTDLRQNPEETTTSLLSNTDVDGKLQPSKNCLTHSCLGSGGTMDCPENGQSNMCDCTGGQSFVATAKTCARQTTVNGHLEISSPGLCPSSLEIPDGRVDLMSSLPESILIAKLGEPEILLSEKRHFAVNSLQMEGKEFSEPGHGETCNCDARLCPCQEDKGDASCLGEIYTKRVPDDIVDKKAGDGENDGVSANCGCGHHGSADKSSDYSVFEGEDNESDEDRDSYLSSGGCSVGDGCVYTKDNCHLGLGPYLCVLNTQNTEIPSLEGSLLPPLSPPTSPSDPGEDLGCADQPFAYAHGEDYNQVDGVVNPYADAVDAEFSQCSPTQGEPEDVKIFCDTSTIVDKLGSSVDKSGGKLGRNSFNNLEQVNGSVPAPDNKAVACQNDGTFNNSGLNSLAPSIPEYGLPSKDGDCRHQVAANGSSEAVDSLSMRDLTKSTDFVSHPSSGHGEKANVSEQTADEGPELLLKADFPILRNEPRVESGLVDITQELSADEVDSDEDMARFSDIEAMILDMDLDVADDDFSARAESRRMYRRHGRSFVRAEQAATAAMQRTLNARGALATLYGRHLKYYMTQTEVLMGRATADNAVDIDLGKEGRANKVSRQQANIKLKDDGVFYLRNLGRRGLTVNNKSVETGQRAILGSNCLIEVGGMRFIFETNKKLVKEHMSRRHQV